jgi:hypothetical protein
MSVSPRRMLRQVTALNVVGGSMSLAVISAALLIGAAPFAWLNLILLIVMIIGFVFFTRRKA